MSYYSKHLSAERLRECYRIAPPRVRKYLEAEIQFVIERLRKQDRVLELGCGYGRVLRALAVHTAALCGVDTSWSSLKLAQQSLQHLPHCRLFQMNAASLAFRNGAYDVVICIQNGLSAFGENLQAVIAEAMRVTDPGGRVLLSSYTEKFWPHRLQWFRLQAEQGLLGEIDWQATADGVIVCRDGFRASTITAEQFASLSAGLGVNGLIQEIDDSSLFCEIVL